MNKPLLNKVKKFIRENPDKFDMFKVAGSVNCGCIAHHAVRLAGDEFRIGESWSGLAGAVLEINQNQSRRLFHVGEWGPSFRKSYFNAKRLNKPTVPIAIRRINHFMKTGR